ncbi:MAG: hypothetical protein HFF51_00840 [Lawsonibacter sp.]|nr:hypothetical protein [Lawsonibacter sp.]
MGYPGPAAARQPASPANEEQQALVDALREEQEGQPDLAEMMKEAREKAAEREEMFKLPKNSRRYGDTAIIAYSKLARARSLGEVDAASGYARRQIAQLRAAKRSDSDNAGRIQAAINQLQKAVNRAGRKKREISQEKLTAKRHARLEKEKRTREAKRLRHQLKCRQTQRMIRESGYLREAEVDNRFQDQIAASKLEMRNQMQELIDQTKVPVETAVQQYAAASAEPAPAPEISVEA